MPLTVHEETATAADAGNGPVAARVSTTTATGPRDHAGIILGIRLPNLSSMDPQSSARSSLSR
ncbi:hypothetical protein SSCG_02197 [Streptomyces clavuligerus]|nr:hypothetical protein SSCG_02197 [Streptomyces clavuligerus]